MTFNINDWYWIVGDTSPTTQVYSSASFGMVANNAAAFLTWLTNGATNGDFGSYRVITAAADNGAGKLRLTLESTNQLQTGQRFNFSGLDGTPLGNGNQQITVIDGTHIDLTAIAFVGSAVSSTAHLQGATFIATFAELQNAFDRIAENFYLGFNKPRVVTTAISSNLALQNPPPALVRVTPSVGGLSVLLPRNFTSSSLPPGHSVVIQHIGGSSFAIKTFDSGITYIASTVVGDLFEFYRDDSAAGGYSLIQYFPTAPDLRIAATDRLVGRDSSGGGIGEEISVTGGIEFSGSQSIRISDDGVTNAKLANMAQNTVKLRITSGTGDPEDGTAEQAAKVINTGRPAFRAHKNATDQTGIASATLTKITFGTEAYDIGSYFDTTNSKWTPPAGRVHLSVTLYSTANIVDQTAHLAAIYKNGGFFALHTFNSSGTGPLSVTVTCEDDANGTDFYEVYYQGNGAGNKTIDGQTYNTYFQGHYL